MLKHREIQLAFLKNLTGLDGQTPYHTKTKKIEVSGKGIQTADQFFLLRSGFWWE